MSEIPLAGPLEITLSEAQSLRVVTSPEPYISSFVQNIILEDGAYVRLSGLTELKLESVVDTSIPNFCPNVRTMQERDLSG